MEAKASEIGAELSDEQIMIAIRKGDRSSYEILMKRYQDDALRLAYHYLHNWEDAKDISQDAFIKVFVKVEFFDPKQKFKPWFFRILVNQCINFLNRKKKIKFFSLFQQTNQDNGILLDQIQNDEKSNEDYQTRQLVWNALERLSPSHREVLILHEMQGFKEHEIGEIMECSVGTVKSRLHYAKEKMRKLLSKEIK